jgi:hypothetical protein
MCQIRIRFAHGIAFEIAFPTGLFSVSYILQGIVGSTSGMYPQDCNVQELRAIDLAGCIEI